LTPNTHLTPDDRQNHDRPPGHGGGPLRAVLAALGAGAADLGEVAASTGLDRGVVSAAVAHLVRTGYLRTEQLTAGCPATGCGSCGSNAGGAVAPDGAGSNADGGGGGGGGGSGGGGVGCPGGTAGIAGRGPVLITLARPGTFRG
jgi:hypothetical protein